MCQDKSPACFSDRFIKEASVHILCCQQQRQRSLWMYTDVGVCIRQKKDRERSARKGVKESEWQLQHVLRKMCKCVTFLCAFQMFVLWPVRMKWDTRFCCFPEVVTKICWDVIKPTPHLLTCITSYNYITGRSFTIFMQWISILMPAVL